MGPERTLKGLQSAGSDAVALCREWRWAIVGRCTENDVAAVRVAAQQPGAPEIEAFLLPYDRLTAVRAEGRWRRMPRRALRTWLRVWYRSALPDAPLVAPVGPSIAVLPYQLVPALAVVSGCATRLLLADPVGTGKTIEAGLVIRELAARGAADRVLVLTPASLRDQWRSELAERCAVHAAVVDRVTFERRRREVPPGVGAFCPPGCHVMSIDLVKQPDVLAAASAVVWDVLVVDEAHLVAGDSARTAATREIAARARVMLLLSATPHTGDPQAFRRLCSLGRHDGEPAITIVRSSESTAARRPPVQREIAARPTPEERLARRHLAPYLRLVERAGSGAGRLIGVVLRKRALSSPAALAASLDHRLRALECRPGGHAQPLLPFADDEHDDDDATQPSVLREAPCFGEDEAGMARTARDAARRAVAASSKLGRLAAMLRRTREPVIVFTEYRDTLGAAAAVVRQLTSVAVLHGGLDRAARAEALATFASGRARVLIATDVAAEGLNLQHACRFVVHFELPWSPARLDQRDGRVDRLGQTRRVHIWRLVGERRHEARVLDALAARAGRVAAAGLATGAREVGDRPASGADATSECRSVEIGADAPGEAARAAMLVRRLLALAPAADADARGRRGLPWVRLRRRPPGFSRGAIVVLLCPSTAPGTRPTLTGVHVGLGKWPEGSPSSWLEAVAAAAAQAVGAGDRRLPHALRDREAAMLAVARRDSRRAARRWQASLFEQRAARIVRGRREAIDALVDQHQRRLADLAALPMTPTAVLALLVR